jgi:Lipocalin-like domain
MFSKKIILLALVAVAALSSCKKDDAVADYNALLTAGKWKLVAETTAGKNTYTAIPACEKDNTYAYAADGKVTFDEGATKCSASDPQSSTGTWAFTGDKKKIILTDGGFAVTLDIVEMTSTSLIWSYADPSAPANVLIQTFGK